MNSVSDGDTFVSECVYTVDTFLDNSNLELKKLEKTFYVLTVYNMASYAFLYKKTEFYKFCASLHFVKMLVGDDPQPPEIVNFVDSYASCGH